MAIAGQIKTFNEAFKFAWNLLVENDQLAPGVGPKLSLEIRRLMKGGASEPSEIGKAAYEALTS